MFALACIVAGAMAAEAEKDLQTAEVNYGGYGGAGLGYAGGNLKNSIWGTQLILLLLKIKLKNYIGLFKKKRFGRWWIQWL